MKTLNVILTVIAFMAIVNVGSAQTYRGDAQTTLESLQNKTSLFNLVASQNTQAIDIGSTTRVRQVGDYNTAFTVTNSNASDIQLTQLGNRNDVNLTISANQISEDVLQVGNNHSFTDYSVGGAQLHDKNVLQLGANQNLILIGGENSISEKMTVTMQGANQTVIIRNLNN